jgi:hypothetical protein
VAKKRKIRNMTRAEHKRALEGAVRNQVAAMREVRGQVFLPRLSKYDSDKDGDMYDQVVQAGQELVQKRHALPGSRTERIVSYYSREDVQRAMYQYARGRKISVLRNFRPMFHGSGLRQPGDIFPLMMFYSQEPRLWPSIHGTISRHDGDGRTVCDLVIEVDFKKSRERSFALARPLIRLFQDLGVEFRVKFSGNASPHIIIPAEAFPANRRKSFQNLYGKLLEFLRKRIKDPKTLDGSFRSPGHFLRMPYSLNENTGMVSLPIRVEDYDRFSWKMAHPDSVEVIEDWWFLPDIPEDAPERTEALIQMALGNKTVFAMDRAKRDTAEEILAPQMPDVLSLPVRMGIVKSGEEIAARGEALMRVPSMQNALGELRATHKNDAQDPAEQRRQANAVAQKYGVKEQDLHLLWRWADNADALAHYSRPDVQEAIYSHVRERCVLMEGMAEYFTLGASSDVPALAAYMVGGGAAPAFRCTNARYDLEDGKMTACDMVIRVERDLSKPVALLFRGFDMPCFALYNGGETLQVVIPAEVLDQGIPQLGSLAEALDRHLKRTLRTQNGIYVSLYEGLRPVPYSLAEDGKRVNLPLRLEDVPRVSPEAASANQMDTIEEIGSFAAPDAEEKAARFFNEIIL